MIRKFLYILIALVTFSACTADKGDNPDNPGGGKQVTVKFNVGARRANTGNYTTEAQACELIKWYRVVITATNSRTILRCIDQDLTTAVELDPMDEFILGEGTYNVYAFANIDRTYLDDLGIKEGGTVPADIASIRFKVPGYFDVTKDADGKYQGALVSVEALAAAGGYIPMTSISPQRINVTERVSQTFNIEVRRMFAKLEFVFKNATEDNLQLNGIAVDSLTANDATSGMIRLMNYEEGRNLIDLPYNPRVAVLSHSFSTPSALVSDNTKTVSHSFYVLESQAHSYSNSFNLHFNITKQGSDPSGAVEDYMRYALTDPATITLIHRNDWIVIPITLSKWQMRLEARTYPPIGGYPEADIDEKQNNEFLVNFQGGGEFTIRPFIRKYYAGEDWFGIDNKLRVVGTPTITVQDNDNLFATQPVLKPTGEIIGKMNVRKGISACITITVTVKDGVDSDGNDILKPLTRKIYVTQK